MPSDYIYVPDFHYGRYLLCPWWLNAATCLLLLWNPIISIETKEPILMAYKGEQPQIFFFFTNAGTSLTNVFLNILVKGRVYWALTWNIIGGWALRLQTIKSSEHSFYERIPNLMSSRQFLLILPFEAPEFKG